MSFARASEAFALLDQAVRSGDGLDGICVALAGFRGRAVAVLDREGRTSAVAGGVARVSEVLRLPVVRPGHEEPEAWLEADGPFDDLDRLVLQHAVTVIGLELLARRVAAVTEHRLGGDVLAAVLAGDLAGDELRERLEPFGLAAELVVLVAEGDEPLAAAFAEAVRAAGAGLAATTGGFACALLPSSTAASGHDGGEPEASCGGADDGNPPPARTPSTADRVRELAERALGDAVFAGVSRATPAADARRAFHEARCALEATAMRGGDRPRLSGFDDLGSFRLLLSLQDGDALRLFCESILAPVTEADAGYNGELERSLTAFIEANGSWERAARRLDIHRHTLRYRVKRIEELTGRSLESASDRTDFWLALRGRELVT